MDGIKVMNKINNHNPDLILLGIVMPEQGGAETVLQISQ